MPREERDFLFNKNCPGFFRELFRCKKQNIDLVLKARPYSSRFAGFSFFSTPSLDLGPGKMFIIISRKVGKAHDRNLLRRRLKALFYQESYFDKPLNTVLITYKGATEKSFLDLKRMVLKHLNQASKSLSSV